MRADKLFAVLIAVVVLVVVGLTIRSCRIRTEAVGPTVVERVPMSSAESPACPDGPGDVSSVDDAAVSDESMSAVQLDGSDELVRRLAIEVLARPEVASFLVTDNLIRRFVSSVQSVAGGYSPRDELDFLRSSERFVVQRSGQHLVIAPSSFRRYRLAVEVFTSCDADDLAVLLERLKPLVERAHEDLPWKRSDFESTLLEAMDHLLVTPIPDGPIQVERRTVTYAFADSTLESLSDAQRLLLRLGPDNALRIRRQLRELRTILYPDETPVRYDSARFDVSDCQDPAPPAGATLVTDEKRDGKAAA